MGVADNKTYKDQYHFNDKWFRVKGEDYPSINDEDKINSTIKENPYRSNVEIEGKEVVLQPDLSALFKAVGKRHNKGGMDVLLKPDSFVFSDDKSLAIDEDEHELFELKKGGNFNPAKNTPAAVLKKNIDIKHYNTLVNNITDPKKDDLAKKSSAMMLEKYIKTLGNIAYIQEEKKNFPTGLPEFSVGTAPVYDKELKDDIMANKQYAKYGGKIDNPKAQLGLWGTWWRSNPKYPTSNITTPVVKTPIVKTPIVTEKSTNKQKGYSGLDPLEEIIDDIINPTLPTPYSVPKINGPEVSTPGNEKLYIPPVQHTVSGEKDNGIDINWQFTPWQKISQDYNWGQYANVKRYMPFKSRFNATYADPALLNEQQAVGNARGVTNQQLASLNTLNPILRNAQAQGALGQLLDQIPQIGLQVEGQNAGFKNQFRQYNNQLKNQETLQNLGFDQQYYTQAVEGRKNFDNMRQFTANQAMDNVMRDVEKNQQLAYNLLTQRPLTNGKLPYEFDFRTGNFRRNPMNLLDVQATSQGNYIENLLKSINFNSLSNAEKIQFVRELQRGKALQYLPQAFGTTPPPFGKKGGRMNPYK